MAIIISYPSAGTVTTSDNLLGTQFDAESGANITKNFSVGKIIALANQAQTPYKVYTAIITQTGMSAPVANVLENTLGVEISWTYIEAGKYGINGDGLFTLNKTTLNCSSMWFGLTQVYPNFEESSFPDEVQILNITSATGVQTNGIEPAFVEIRVYN